MEQITMDFVRIVVIFFDIHSQRVLIISVTMLFIKLNIQ